VADRPRKRRLRITPRDTEIFEDLLNRRADTLASLHQRHFATNQKDSARNRLGQLCAWGYLERCSVPHMPDALAHPADTGAWTSAYTLTPKAVAALRRRSLAGSTLRGRSVKVDIAEPAIPHQLAVTRIADILGATLTCEHLLEASAGQRRHRPDGAYPTAPDRHGRSVVMLEVDLGHYSRQRILGKVDAFLADPDAKGVLFACPTDIRAAWVARAIRDAHGQHAMDRLQILSFQQIKDDRLLREDLRPTPPDATNPTALGAGVPRAA
jgi:hypothetical protein